MRSLRTVIRWAATAEHAGREVFVEASRAATIATQHAPEVPAELVSLVGALGGVTSQLTLSLGLVEAERDEKLRRAAAALREGADRAHAGVFHHDLPDDYRLRATAGMIAAAAHGLLAGLADALEAAAEPLEPKP